MIQIGRISRATKGGTKEMVNAALSRSKVLVIDVRSRLLTSHNSVPLGHVY